MATRNKDGYIYTKKSQINIKHYFHFWYDTPLQHLVHIIGSQSKTELLSMQLPSPFSTLILHLVI